MRRRLGTPTKSAPKLCVSDAPEATRRDWEAIHKLGRRAIPIPWKTHTDRWDPVVPTLRGSLSKLCMPRANTQSVHATDRGIWIVGEDAATQKRGHVGSVPEVNGMAISQVGAEKSACACSRVQVQSVQRSAAGASPCTDLPRNTWKLWQRTDISSTGLEKLACMNAPILRIRAK